MELAKLIEALPGLRFRGVMSHQVIGGAPDRETRFIEGRRAIQTCLDVRDSIEAAGIPVEIVSSGESWTYDVAGDIPGVTEVQGGTYILMDTSYGYMSEFQYAGKVLGTVISKPRPGVAIGDVGMEAVGNVKGLPTVDGMPGVTVSALDVQHTMLQLEGDCQPEHWRQIPAPYSAAGRYGEPVGQVHRRKGWRGRSGVGHPGTGGAQLDSP